MMDPDEFYAQEGGGTSLKEIFFSSPVFIEKRDKMNSIAQEKVELQMTS